MIDPHDLTRFEPFTIHKTSYKSVHDHPITVDVMYPTKLLSDPATLAIARPVIVRFHGGGLITGASLYPGFFAEWLLALTQRHDAIIVSADTRLLPESSPADIQADISDLWSWIQSSLPVYLDNETQGSVKVDLGRVVTTGESAGGLLSLLLALDQSNGIRAVMVQYPMVDLKSAHFTQDFDKKPFGMPISQFPRSLIDDLQTRATEHEASKGSKLVVSSDPLLSRIPAMFAALQHGLFDDLIQKREGGTDMYVFDRLRRGRKLPTGGVFVWHGGQDTVVPVQGSHELVRTAKETDPDVKIKLEIQPGEHGFDSEVTLEDDWIKESISEVEQAWLS